MNFRMLFFKLTKRFDFGRAGSKLFHSMTVERKKERVFDEVVSKFRTGNVINVSCSICMVFFRY